VVRTEEKPGRTSGVDKRKKINRRGRGDGLGGKKGWANARQKENKAVKGKPRGIEIRMKECQRREKVPHPWMGGDTGWENHLQGC